MYLVIALTKISINSGKKLYRALIFAYFVYSFKSEVITVTLCQLLKYKKTHQVLFWEYYCWAQLHNG